MLSYYSGAEQLLYDIIFVSQSSLQYVHRVLTKKRRWLWLGHFELTESYSWPCSMKNKKEIIATVTCICNLALLLWYKR